MRTDHVTEENLEIVLDWIDAMRIGDPDRFARRLASDIVWWDLSGADPPVAVVTRCSSGCAPAWLSRANASWRHWS